MKNQTHTNLPIRYSFALALALAIWSPVPARSAEAAEGEKMTEAKMMEQCQEMKAQKAKMKADMKAQDADLTAQLTEMNRAPQNQKTDLMAAVVTHMVEQRIAMDARKAKMEDEMMLHMQRGKESTTQCPMMKGLKGMDEKPVDAHLAHQTGQ